MGNIVKVFSKETQKNKKTLKNKKRKFSKQKASRFFVLFFALIFILYFILIEISPQKTFAAQSFYTNWDGGTLDAYIASGDKTAYTDSTLPRLVDGGYGGLGKAIQASRGDTLKYQTTNNLDNEKVEYSLMIKNKYDLSGVDQSKNKLSYYVRPKGLVYDAANKHIYIIDNNLARLVKTNWEGTVWETSLEGMITNANRMVYDSASSYFYITSGNCIIKTKFDGTGWVKLCGFNSPKGVAYDSATDFLYVADYNNHQIVKTKIDGSGWETFGSYGSDVNQFKNPIDLVFHNNYLYISDSRNHRVVKTKFNGDGWTTLYVDGQTANWGSIDYDPIHDFIYVNTKDDSNGGTLIKTKIDGSSQSSLGSFGYYTYDFFYDPVDDYIYWYRQGYNNDPGSFYRKHSDGSGQTKGLLVLGMSYGIAHPLSVWKDSGYIYVTSYNNTIFKIREDNTFFRYIGSSGFGTNQFLFRRWVDSGSLTVDPVSQNIYVIDNGKYNNVIKTDESLSIWHVLGGFSLGGINDLSYDHNSDFLYVTDGGNNRIVKSHMDGTGKTYFGTAGSGEGQFSSPSGIWYDSSSGYLYVSDKGNNRIVKTQMDGTGWTTLTGFSGPRGIFYDSASEYLYVADTGNNRIVKTKIDGTGWTTLDGFSSPQDVSYDPATGYMYVADSGNNRIVKTKIDGTGWTNYTLDPRRVLFKTQGDEMRLELDLYSQRLKFWMKKATGGIFLQSEPLSWGIDEWHKVAVYFNKANGKVELKIDDKVVDSAEDMTWTNSLPAFGDYIYISSDPANPDAVNVSPIDNFTVSPETIDTTPPNNPTNFFAYDSISKNIRFQDNSWTNDSSPYFEFSGASDPDSGLKGYWVYFGPDPTADPITAGVWQNHIGVDGAIQSYTPSLKLNSGTVYYLKIKTKDNDLNYTDEAVVGFTYKYDGVAPQNPAYIHAPSEFLGTKKITIFWPTSGVGVASDEHSGLLGYQYKINNCPWYGPNHSDPNGLLDYFPAEVGSYETQKDYDFECLEEGTNTIYLRTIDNAGNISLGTIQAVVKINTQAPSEPINLTVSPSYSKINKFSFSWEEPKIKPGGVGIKEYRYSVNSLPSETNYSVATQAYLPPDSYATVRGKNVFYVVAVSESGKVNYDNYAQIIFECDSPAPGIPRNVEIFDNSIRETKNYKVGLTWDPPLYLGTGFSGYKIYRSENPQANCAVDMSLFKEIATTSGTAYVDSNLESKTYYYCLKAYDNTNQMSPPSTTVSLKPTGRWKTPPNLIEEPQSFVRTKSAIITWLTDRKSNSFVQYRKPHQEYKEEVGSSEYVIYHSINLVNLDPGTTYYYRVMWTDEDGNRGVSDEYSFTTNPPPIVSQVNISDISLYSAYLSFTTKNAVQANIYYGKTTMYGGVMKILTSPEQSSYTLRFSGLEDDSVYHYMIELIDEEGNKYPFEDHLFKTLPKPRIFDVRIEQVLDRPSPTLKITFKSNTDISTIVTYFPEKNPSLRREEAKLDLEKDHQIEITGLKDNTIYILQAQGFDKVGNMAVSDLQRFTTAEDTRPPKISDFFVNTKVEGQGREAQAQIIVSWKTDEPATSQVAWSSEISDIYTNYTREDPTLTYEHLVVISGLKPGSIYHLAAVSYDKARNQSFSEDWVILTPKATQSILDLTIESLRNIFGR